MILRRVRFELSAIVHPLGKATETVGQGAVAVDGSMLSNVA